MKTLLAIIAIIQRTHGKRLLLRLFSSFMVILGLMIVTAMMVSATLIGVLINAHIALLNSGMSLPLALLLVGFAAVFIIATLIAVIVWQLARLRRIPQTLYGQSPLMGTLDAFTAGLMAD